MAIGKTPNLYQLGGGGLHISYATTSISGQPIFGYQDKTQSRSFTGSDQIRTEETSIGSLVTVTLHITPDSGSTTFSLLVPTVALGDGDSLAISTFGVTTMHRTSLIGPPLGQDDHYDTTLLQGTAASVVF